MPKFNLNEADVRALVIFLKSRHGMNFAETSLDQYRLKLNEVKLSIGPPGQPELKGATPATRGKQLIEERACTACHKLGSTDGGIAPDLSYEGLVKDREWMVDHFRNPRSRVPDSIMPAFRFPEEDFDSMAGYLESLKTPPRPCRPPKHSRFCALAVMAKRAMVTARWPGIWTRRRAT